MCKQCKHTAKTTQEWLRDSSVNVLVRPSQSPDMNIIVPFWWDLKMAVHWRSPSNLTELEKICRKECQNPPQNPQNQMWIFSLTCEIVIFPSKKSNFKGFLYSDECFFYIALVKRGRNALWENVVLVKLLPYQNYHRSCWQKHFILNNSYTSKYIYCIFAFNATIKIKNNIFCCCLLFMHFSFSRLNFALEYSIECAYMTFWNKLT